MSDPNTPTDEPTRAEAVERVRDLIRRSAPSFDDDCAIARATLRQRSGTLARLVVELADELAASRAEMETQRAQDAGRVAWISGAVVDDTEPLGGGFTADPGTAQDELATLRYELADHVHALDLIRAACESAGIPGERNLPSRDREDPTPILEHRSTPALVAALVEDRDRLADENARFRAALDAIRRAFAPTEGCLPDCLSMYEDASGREDDCTCGYDDAADDPGAFAAEALEGRWP